MTAKKLYKLQKQGNLLWCRVAFGCSDSELVVTAKLLIDTGASYTMVSDRLVRSIVDLSLEDLPRTAILTANGRISAPIVPVPWMNCFGERIEQFPILACALPTRTFIDGLLGMDFLGRCRAVIDVSQAEISVS